MFYLNQQALILYSVTRIYSTWKEKKMIRFIYNWACIYIPFDIYLSLSYNIYCFVWQSKWNTLINKLNEVYLLSFDLSSSLSVRRWTNLDCSSTHLRWSSSLRNKECPLNTLEECSFVKHYYFNKEQLITVYCVLLIVRSNLQSISVFMNSY